MGNNHNDFKLYFFVLFYFLKVMFKYVKINKRNFFLAISNKNSLNLIYNNYDY